MILAWEVDMTEYKIRYFDEEDGCTYCWDPSGRRWLKVCPVGTLPDKIKERVLKGKMEAELLLDVLV
jgi:hypothetical protein